MIPSLRLTIALAAAAMALPSCTSVNKALDATLGVFEPREAAAGEDAEARPASTADFNTALMVVEVSGVRRKIAIELDPDFAEAYNQCAIAHFFLGQWEAAIRDSRRALTLMPSHFGAMSGMGHCYAHLGDLEAALRCYRESVRINPRMTAVADAIERLEAKLQSRNDSSGMFQIMGSRR